VHGGIPYEHGEKDADGFSGYPNHDPKCIRHAIRNSTWGRMVRNVLFLERCSPRLRPRSMMVILLGTGVHTLQG
jgi:hypothetical protein